MKGDYVKTEKELLRILDREMAERNFLEQLILSYGQFAPQEVKDEYLKRFTTVHVLKYVLGLQ